MRQGYRAKPWQRGGFTAAIDGSAQPLGYFAKTDWALDATAMRKREGGNRDRELATDSDRHS
jgi:hypothetical protein